MNVLFLSHRIPFPPHKGDKIRSYNEIKHLSKSKRIFLASFTDGSTKGEDIENLRKYCAEMYLVPEPSRMKILKAAFSGKPLTVEHFFDRRIQKYVDSVIESRGVDVVFCYCSSMAEYVFRSKWYRRGKLAGVKTIIDYVDLDSDKWLQYAMYAKFPMNIVYGTENRRLQEYEIRINREFDHSVFVSRREEEIFRNVYPEMGKVSVISNGVNWEYFLPKVEPAPSREGDRIAEKEYSLVFTGVMDYFANVDGVEWFCRNIFPLIREKVGNVKFYIVGQKPLREVRDLQKEAGVVVTGYVEDIRKYYWMADICVIPLRIARGLQNKVLEAMSTGNAVVATTNASEGIACNNRENIVIADNEADFAKSVVDLLLNKEARRVMGRNARENILRHYSWDTNLSQLERIMEE